MPKKTEIQKTKIRKKMLGNQNAKKHGLYSRTPPTLICNTCPNTHTCPYYKPGNLCHFEWIKLIEFDKKLKQ